MYKTNIPVKRPVYKNGDLVGYVGISLQDKEFLNNIILELGFRSKFFLGYTEEERRLLQYGTEEELKEAGFIE